MAVANSHGRENLLCIGPAHHCHLKGFIHFHLPSSMRIDTRHECVISHTRDRQPVAKRFYPAVLERGPKGTFAIWFPDFPDCVAGGAAQEDALAKSEVALAKAVDALAEADHPLPKPTAFEDISLPRGSRPIAYFAVSVEPPNPSERVNIYLPKNLITQADQRAEELGMSRSSFFGLAISVLIGRSYDMTSLMKPRSIIETGEKSSPVTRARK